MPLYYISKPELWGNVEFSILLLILCAFILQIYESTLKQNLIWLFVLAGYSFKAMFRKLISAKNKNEEGPYFSFSKCYGA